MCGIARDDPRPDWATTLLAEGATDETSTDRRIGRDITAISLLADDLLCIAALAVDVESITTLRSGDQLDEIGTTMPNGFIGQG